MRYKQGHKEETRQRIVEVASRRFRREGMHEVGVAGLMADAGLTHGGFYAHFKSKEELVREAVAAALDGTTGNFEQLAAGPRGGLRGILGAYLSRTHRDHPQTGCAAATLAAELVRHPVRTRRAFTDSLKNLIDLIADQLTAIPPAARRKRAIAIFGLMMGTLQLARAEPDPDRSKAILDGGVEAALVLGGEVTR